MSEAFDSGVYKVVTPAELEAATRDGWRLVRVLDGAAPPQPVHVEVPIRMRDSSGCEWTDTHKGTAFVGGTGPAFLLRLDPESAIAAAEMERAKALADVATHKADATAARDIAAKKAEETARATARAELAERRRDEERDRATKMERDLGRVAKAVGDLRMREILAEVAK